MKPDDAFKEAQRLINTLQGPRSVLAEDAHKDFCARLCRLNQTEFEVTLVTKTVKFSWLRDWTATLSRDASTGYSLLIELHHPEDPRIDDKNEDPVAIEFDGSDVVGTEDDLRLAPSPGEPIAKRDALVVVFQTLVDRVQAWKRNEPS